MFENSDWFNLRFDGRKKIFKGILKDQFEVMRTKHYNRMITGYIPRDKYKSRRELIERFKNIPYIYDGDGYDDYSKYQRPASNGVGYVAICPGERANNIYVDDPITVSYLKKKFKKHFNE